VTVADLEDVRRIAANDAHLAVLAVARKDGTVQTSVVNAGVIGDPVDGEASIGLVAMGASRKLALLRENPHASVVFKHGPAWVAVSGPTRLLGPDDPASSPLDVPATIREVFVAAGGTHDDWEEFDRVMAADRRCAIFVHAVRISANG
jgi:hypothetical protein